MWADLGNVARPYGGPIAERRDELGELAQAASMDVVWWKDRLLCKLELWREDERARLRMGPRL